MRLGRGHSPTQHNHRTCFFLHPPFFIQISIWNEFTGYVRDRWKIEIYFKSAMRKERLSVECFTLRSTDFSHCREVDFLDAPAATCCARDASRNRSENACILVLRLHWKYLRYSCKTYVVSFLSLSLSPLRCNEWITRDTIKVKRAPH